MLIEDDVYSELYFGREKPLPAKFWDRQGDDAALQLVLKMSGTRLSYRLGGGRQTGAADPAAPADEYAFHQFADAVSPRWITCPPSAMTPTCAVYVVSWRSVNSRPGRRCCAICRRRSSSTTATAATFCGSNYRKGPTLAHLASGRWRRTSVLPRGKCSPPPTAGPRFSVLIPPRGWGGTRRAGG